MNWTDTAAALQAADTFALQAAGLGHTLDYQPASVAVLEKYLLLLRSSDAFRLRSDPRGREASLVLEPATIYFLEVLRRVHTGQWMLPGGELVVQLKEGKLSLRADGLFASLLGPGGFEMSPVDLFKEFSLKLTATLGQQMRREAEDARRLPMGHLFDFSPQSVEVLEQTLLYLHTELRSDSPTGRSLRETLRPLTLQLGAYLGECIIGHVGGQWVDGTDEGGLYLLELPGEKGSCFPVGKVAKMLDNGAEDSVLAFFRVVAKK